MIDSKGPDAGSQVHARPASHARTDRLRPLKPPLGEDQQSPCVREHTKWTRTQVSTAVVHRLGRRPDQSGAVFTRTRHPAAGLVPERRLDPPSDQAPPDGPWAVRRGLVIGRSREAEWNGTPRRSARARQASTAAVPGRGVAKAVVAGRQVAFSEHRQYAPNDQKTPTSSSVTAIRPRSSKKSRPLRYSEVRKPWDSVPWRPAARKSWAGSEAAAVALVQ